MLEITTDNFDEQVLQSDIPVLIDFWAPWCGPCKMQGPIVDELAEEYKDKPVKIGKVNIDENQELAMKYNIVSIPTIVIFDSGEVKEQMSGVQQKTALAEKIDAII